jgi:hypothetical protein
VSVTLLAFDASGQLIGVHDRQSAQSFAGAITTEPVGKYAVPSAAPLGMCHYLDCQTFTIDLDGLLAPGIRSVAVAVSPYPGWPLAKFKRKAIKIVDPESKVEIGLSHIAVPWAGKKWGTLAGGLVLENDGFSWMPGGDMAGHGSLAGYVACWLRRLPVRP